jgi:hypothetical protein
MILLQLFPRVDQTSASGVDQTSAEVGAVEQSVGAAAEQVAAASVAVTDTPIDPSVPSHVLSPSSAKAVLVRTNEHSKKSKRVIIFFKFFIDFWVI